MIDEDIGEMATSAQAAKELLDNHAFNQAYEKMNTQLVEQLLATPMDGKDERERLFVMFKGGQMFVQQLAHMINNYELATQEDIV
jgi:hypothetical protein